MARMSVAEAHNLIVAEYRRIYTKVTGNGRGLAEHCHHCDPARRLNLQVDEECLGHAEGMAPVVVHDYAWGR